MMTGDPSLYAEIFLRTSAVGEHSGLISVSPVEDNSNVQADTYLDFR
jgi:hypothetical protein